MKGLFGRLRDGLQKTRDGLRETIDRVSGQDRLTEEMLEELEEGLLQADVGVQTSEKLLSVLRDAPSRPESEADDWAVRALRAEITSILAGARSAPPDLDSRPRVVMVVGVNGTGKTTTIGKLAWRYRQEGHRVLVVAADTFRAAANEQLARWAERAGAEIIQSQPGSDPASVAFDGVSAGRARQQDVVIVDTAGRLHSKVGLMEELTKIHRVIGKAMPGAPHDVLLVLDGTTGQNAVQQATEFTKGVAVTGLVLTKIDGTARGGVVVSIADTLELPVRYLGVGEGLEDLIDFEPDAFAEALLDPA